MKFSYHPKEKRFQYAFTDRIWDAFHSIGQGKSNREKIKFKEPSIVGDQVLANIYIDKSALFRVDEANQKFIKLNFPRIGATELILSLENGKIFLYIRYIKDYLNKHINDFQEKIYLNNPDLNNGIKDGCAQQILNNELPLKLAVFGI